MHVGFFIDGYYPIIDGVIKVVDAYASRLVKKCDVTVFTPYTRNQAAGYDDSFPYEVVRCWSIMRKKDDYPQGYPIVDPKFRNAIKNAGLDIIHVHSAFPIGLCAKASARRLGIPLVGTIHSDFRPDVVHYLGKMIGEPVIKLMMSVYNSCDECWTVSDAVGQMFIKDYGLKRPYRIMPYSTDHYPVSDETAAREEVNAAYGLEDDDFVLTHVGRLDLQKREDFIVRSLAVLKKQLPAFKVLFVGEGNKQDYVKSLVEKLGLADNVVFCGKVADPHKMMSIYARTDLLLFPSESDTYGLVKIEAACQKTPTLFSEGTMAADGITDGVDGFVSKNSEEAFAEYILRIHNDRKFLDRVGEGARRNLYRTWDNLVDDVYENYLKIIENHNFVRR
ncbi:MAG: glycosyltransferase [Bacteroidales bacterium]|nr:glycosyltransferase [Bacteroidales bacterium]